jgi:hypothetical protein
MNFSKPLILCLILGGLLIPKVASAGPVTGGVNPNYVKVKIFEVRASPNEDCSNLVPIFNNASPDYMDAAHNPTFGTGSLPNGTYKCFAIKMSDNIKSQPASNQGTRGKCVGGQGEVVQDVAQPWTPGIYSQAPDGTHIPLTVGEDIVWLYWRIGGSSGDDPTGDRSFRPDKGMLLSAPLTVVGDKDLTFVFNFDGKVGESCDSGCGDPANWYCSADAPVMSVR